MNRHASIALLLPLLASCSRPPLSGPPELRLGREECMECGMLIAEDRFSCASIIEQDDDRFYVFFDDVGCLLDYEHEKGKAIGVIERYVHDSDTKQWVDAQKACFILADHERLRTPMGSGIAAFADSTSCASQAKDYGVSTLPFADLVTARRAWMHARYGVPDGSVPSSPAEAPGSR